MAAENRYPLGPDLVTRRMTVGMTKWDDAARDRAMAAVIGASAVEAVPLGERQVAEI